MAESGEAEILFERRGAVGLVTLNRPRALNALSRAMIEAMQRQLDAWAAETSVTRIVLRGRGERAFCAGGDIREIHALATAGDHAGVDAFWRGEYRLDATVKHFPKPVISLIAGLVMGGGNGISVHGSHRVSSEDYSFAMPEVGIGLFPDVGMTYALPRLPGFTGTYLALTGTRIGPGDAHAVGLATHHAAAADFDALVEALAEGGPVEPVLAAHARPVRKPGCWSASAPASTLLLRRDRAGDPSPPRRRRLRLRGRDGGADAHALAHQPRAGARADAPGRAHELPEAMRTEYRMVSALMRGSDFFEGVRAAVIDKDGAPAWSPATLEAVDARAIAAAFAPGPAPEPDFAPDFEPRFVQ